MSIVKRKCISFVGTHFISNLFCMYASERNGCEKIGLIKVIKKVELYNNYFPVCHSEICHLIWNFFFWLRFIFIFIHFIFLRFIRNDCVRLISDRYIVLRKTEQIMSTFLDWKILICFSRLFDARYFLLIFFLVAHLALFLYCSKCSFGNQFKPKIIFL